MKYFRLLWCTMLLAMAGIASAQPAAPVCKVVKSATGQSYLLASASTDGVLYTDVYFRIGTIYELDSTSGISVMITKILDARIHAALSGRRIAYHSTTQPEQLGFHFESGAADFDYILTLIHDKIMNARFDQDAVDEAQAEVKADLDSLRYNDATRADSKIKKHLWGRDYKKLNVYGDKVNYAHLVPAQFTAFYYKFFLPLNNSIVLTGTFSEQEAVNKMQAAFKDFRTKEFNPELIRRVIEFRPIINNIQVLAKGPDTALATIIYQNPGARQDRSATYCAFILSQLINDADGRVQRSVAGTGIRDLKASYDCDNFEGTMTLSARITSRRYTDAFTALDSLIGGFCHKDYFNAEEITAATGAIAAEFSEFRSHRYSFMTQVARYRFSNDENYFTSLADSIQAVTVTDMQDYVNNYYVNHAGIKCLYAHIDSMDSIPAGQRYYALDDSVREVSFTYPQNITDIDSVTGHEDLMRLIQWLTINPYMHVQINGFSDKSEYIKSYDTTVTNFIKATPTFRKAMPDAIKVGYLRIEMMRAMKIAKALYEAGIAEDRISGTSMTFSSDDAEAAAVNRKCTVTLDRIQPRLSLYEYHFGKKKPEEDPSVKP